MILNVENISKNYGVKKLFEKITFSLESKDKIGVIGNNGTGKSTLLKVLSLLEEPDEGKVEYGNSVKIGYLPQSLDLNDDFTVMDHMKREFGSQADVLLDHEIKTALTKLGFYDFDEKISHLSGGQKRRLALAQTLVVPSDVLILDEPINHLDAQMIIWLEKLLINFNKVIIMVTHDRYFLERITNKIYELEDGNLYIYRANYSQYLSLKLEREEKQISSKRKLDAFLRKEQQWISRGAKARTTKDRRRINQFEELSEISFGKKEVLDLESTASRLGRKTIELKNINKAYQNPLIKNFTFIIPNDARIGITGENGCGKTTLLKIMAQLIMPDSGQVIIGETVKIGYLSQENDILENNLRIIDFIKRIAEVVKSGKNSYSALQMLEKFLFDNPFALIGTLSGGEKRRLMLLALLMSSPNILLLDEPTNDLDISTMNIFESYLDDFEGAVIVASHDRFFLDKVCDRFFDFEENGVIKAHLGKYSDFLAQPIVNVPKEKGEEENRKKMPTNRLTFQEQLEFQGIEQVIDDLENQISMLDLDITKTIGNYELQKPLLDKKTFLEAKINEKLQRWEYLSLKEEDTKRKKP